MEKNRELKYRIGLEVHVQLDTQCKLFSASKSSSTEPENTNVDIVDIGVPGTFIRINEECVNKAIRLAKLLNCQIADEVIFDRKHYSYIDLPMGYQITQFRKPIGTKGQYKLLNEKVVEIKEMHLETDAAKINDYGNKVTIDYNRCGRALVEIVTGYGDYFSDAKDVELFLDMLVFDLRQMKISQARFELSNIRADVNISCLDVNTGESSVRLEIKNLSSYDEIATCIKLAKEELKKFSIKQDSTMHFDEQTGKLYVARPKESMLQYRYMYEPSLRSVKTHMFSGFEEEYTGMCKYEIVKQAMEQVGDSDQNRQAFSQMMSAQNGDDLLKAFYRTVRNGETEGNRKVVQHILEFQESVKWMQQEDAIEIASFLIRDLVDKKLLKVDVLNLFNEAINNPGMALEAIKAAAKSCYAEQSITEEEIIKIIQEEDASLLSRIGSDNSAFNFCIGLVRKQRKGVDIQTIKSLIAKAANKK